MQKIMYLEKPENFSSQVNVVACYLENNNKILFLRYNDNKLQGNWGVPAGKIDDGEQPIDTILREVYEETKIWLTADELCYVGKVYFREPHDYTFHIFKAMVPNSLVNKVIISKEHQNYLWVDYKEAIKLPLVYGAKEALEHCLKFDKKTRRNKIVPSAYLILKKHNRYLLYLRHNTGFEDGKYGLVAGHIEQGESAKQAIIREALEEANIIIAEQDLKFAHVSCRQSERENIDIFFECDKWQGDIANNEPHKCAKLQFFAIADFPQNIIEYIRDIIFLNEANVRYSEIGWSRQEVIEPGLLEEHS